MPTDDELAAESFPLDTGRSNIVLITGTKGRGKSSAARQYFDAWPYDRVVIDPSGDARPDDPYTLAMTAPFPSQMPSADEAAKQLGVDVQQLKPKSNLDPRVTVWARVDPRSPTFEYDQDQALNLALYPRHNNTMVWHDEYGLAGTAQKIGANMKLLVMSSRHYYATAILACPRPRHIPTLTIQQADKVLMFAQPNPDDREVIAHNAGIDLPKFERAYSEMKRMGHHAYLLWDPAAQVLFICAPLPAAKHNGPRA